SYRVRSSIALAADHVDHVEGGHDVGEQCAAHHVAHGVRVPEARGPASALPRLPAAVADEVEPELPVRALDREVHVTRGWAHAFGDQLELVDQLFHAVEDLALGRPPEARIVDVHRPVGKLAETLLDDARALAYLLDADEVPVVVVTVRPDGHVEVELVID